jgi:hypothetical protein
MTRKMSVLVQYRYDFLQNILDMWFIESADAEPTDMEG